jgi:hypothetical protein
MRWPFRKGRAAVNRRDRKARTCDEARDPPPELKKAREALAKERGERREVAALVDALLGRQGGLSRDPFAEGVFPPPERDGRGNDPG